jgi:hypothetical protein
MFFEYDTVWEVVLSNSDTQTFAANMTSEIESYAQKKNMLASRNRISKMEIWKKRITIQYL